MAASPALMPKAQGLYTHVQSAVRTGQWRFAYGWWNQIQCTAEYAARGSLRAIESQVGRGRVDAVVEEFGQLTNIEFKYWTQSTLLKWIGALAKDARNYLKNSPNALRIEFRLTRTDPITSSADDILKKLGERIGDVTRLEARFL